MYDSYSPVKNIDDNVCIPVPVKASHLNVAFSEFFDKMCADQAIDFFKLNIVFDGKQMQKRKIHLGQSLPDETPRLFKIVSLSKTMVSVLVIKLHELGILDIKDPVTDYLYYHNEKLEGVGSFPDLTDISIEDLQTISFLHTQCPGIMSGLSGLPPQSG